MSKLWRFAKLKTPCRVLAVVLLLAASLPPLTAAEPPPLEHGSQWPRISGYLLSAETRSPLRGVQVQLYDSRRTVVASTTTSETGYYEFVLVSRPQADTQAEQAASFTPGEIHVSSSRGEYNAIFSVYYSAEDWDAGKNKYQWAYIYASRVSWGWEDAQPGLHQFFVLQPPAFIRGNQTPVVLVHGHAGKDSTWLGLRPPLEQRGYQVWEVYYAGRDHIVECAAALKDAVEVVLQNYQGGQVDMVTHSMGGPVARSYVAGTARYPWNSGRSPLQRYTPRVRKLLQLGPPNFGVLNAVRLSPTAAAQEAYCGEILTVLRLLGYQNPEEPALQDLRLASSFYVELYHHPVRLAPQDFLIVAGTNPFLTVCPEAKDQTDLLVGNSSSSLLNQGIPLGLVYRDHAQMLGQNMTVTFLPPSVVVVPQPLLDSNDNPYDNALPLVEVIDGFLRGDILRVKQNLDVFVNPRGTGGPRGWEVTVVDRSTVPPRLVTRIGWPANQWNDQHYDTNFDAGGFWLRIADWVPNAARGKVRVCDPVHNQCWELTRAVTTGLWFLEDDERGYVLPASEFGYPYTAILHDGGAEVELGQFEVRPMQIVSVTLGSKQVFFPSVFKAGALGSGPR